MAAGLRIGRSIDVARRRCERQIALEGGDCQTVPTDALGLRAEAFALGYRLNKASGAKNRGDQPRRSTMARRTNVVPKEMEVIKERFHYNPGVKATGHLLFIAGQVGRDQNLNVIEGKAAPFVQAFEKVKAVLSAAGAPFDDVVDMVTYHTDMRDLQL